MKDEIINKLESDERLLFYGSAHVDKTSKQLGKFALAFGIVIFFVILIIYGVNYRKEINYKTVSVSIVLILMTLCLIYGLIYNIFLKYKNKNNEYFVTNKKLGIYNLKTGFVNRNISDLVYLGIVREKDNYGDLIFNFKANNLVEQAKNGISFEGVENPRKLAELITEDNKNIHIYDDRTTLYGTKF